MKTMSTRTILVLVERTKGELDDSALELACAARRLAAGGPLHAAVTGNGLGDLPGRLSEWFDRVHVFDDPQLDEADGEATAELLFTLIERERPWATLIPHTNNGMDLAPVLAMKTDCPLIADCLSLTATAEGLSAVRAMYGGKVHARVTARASDKGLIATVRPGSCAADAEAPGAGGTVVQEPVPERLMPHRRFVETLTPAAGAVDITQAEVLVAVGRGIEEEENLEIIRSLAEALGAEVACSRPVVDKNWLPKNHQVGTSGLTVKPRIYIAAGISGSFQHMGGLKGGPFIVAINKDPAAPIFGVADVGIVGDLFDIIPLLEDKIRELKG
jgi:electron transfer flavoprotein alpha subunit